MALSVHAQGVYTGEHYGSITLVLSQWVGQLTCMSEVLSAIPGLATYFLFSFCCFKRGSCQLLVKECAQSTG